MEKIANPTRTGQILEIPNRRARSRAILEYTRCLKAESRARVQQMLIEAGFIPRSLPHRMERRAA